MENICILDFVVRRCWRPVRLAVQNRYESLRIQHYPATPLTALLAFSRCMDHSLCPYGHRCYTGLDDAPEHQSKQWAKSIRDPVNHKLFLESDFLQRPGLRDRLPMAASALDPGSVDDIGIPEIGQTGRKYSDPLSALADLRRLPESGCMVFKLNTKRTPFGVRFFMLRIYRAGNTGQIYMHFLPDMDKTR